ncbi:MAG: DUF4837 family protein [Crocinitomicaceae bacterium]|nr:DUF4837 family protein [Crocinitomicaceae bacterium]
MKKLLIALFLPLLLISCLGDSDLTSHDLLPDATGERGHIMVIMDDNLWNGSLGDTLRSQFDQNIDGPFIRSEPMFGYHQVKPGTLNHINKSSRLILKIFVDHDSTYAETAIIEKYDFYAKGQLFLVIKDSDVDRLYDFVKHDFNKVIDLYNNFEKEQLMAHYKRNFHKSINEQAEKKFGISIYLPKESKLKVEKENFMWVKYDRSRNLMSNEATGADGGTFWIQEGIIFWSEPYSDEAIDPYHILEKRDSVLKYNIPGKVNGSWMTTEYDPCCAPEGLVTTIDGHDAVIFEGNWKHGGNPAAVGGGPFVQYSIHNPNENSVVTVCGYVYAPKFNKREYIRELHAMLSSIKIN